MSKVALLYEIYWTRLPLAGKRFFGFGSVLLWNAVLVIGPGNSFFHSLKTQAHANPVRFYCWKRFQDRSSPVPRVMGAEELRQEQRKADREAQEVLYK